jgi:2-C-methyl-D-erythritol 4-phosphate cytidylyltransferase
VAAGLAALPAHVDLVLVHDVARPFVPVEVIERVLAALADGADAVVPVVAIHDTVRRIDGGGMLGELVDRSTLAAMQTPQGFRREVLAEAHARGAQSSTTDDAALVQALGTPVVAVAGSDAAFKITTPADLARAQAILAAPS